MKDKRPLNYISGKDKTNVQANSYSKTDDSSHRYLAYRDIEEFLGKYFKNYSQHKVALDFGTGTGCSAKFLNDCGFEVIGVDLCQEMLALAKSKYPDYTFILAKDNKIPFEQSIFDLVFSSFVLFEIASLADIVKYLSEAKRVLKKDGLFIAVTGSQLLHSSKGNWLNFNTKYPENENPRSGDLVKLFHYESSLEFVDYYWTELDYRNCFSKADLDLVDIIYPLGKKEDSFQWKDELTKSPFVILIAKKAN